MSSTLCFREIKVAALGPGAPPTDPNFYPDSESFIVALYEKHRKEISCPSVFT